MQEQSRQARTAFAAATAWLPAIMAAGADTFRRLSADPPRAVQTALADVVRRRRTQRRRVERIVAGTADGGAGQAIGHHRQRRSPYPVTWRREVTLDAAAYTKYRAAAKREDRLKVFGAFWGRYNDFTRTLGTALNSQVQAHEFSRKVRKFDSALAEALFGDNVPTAVYTQLIADIHANLPTLHRYLRLRQRMMGLASLGYEDLYAPMLARYDKTYSPEQAKAVTLAAVASLGVEYQEILGKGFEGGWIDWFPRTGKRSGAYSTGAYGLHPFQLQNFTGLYEEVPHRP
jgi:oligoendopeptidase F